MSAMAARRTWYATRIDTPSRHTAMRLRPYTPADRAACAALFESNLPELYGPDEIEHFLAHLDAPPGPYFVLENDRGVAVACGGFCRDAQPGRARLNWGVVGRQWHRLRYGQLLLLARLTRLMLAYPDVERVDTHISHYLATFLQSAGFVADRVTDDGYAPGLNRYDLHLDLSPAVRARLACQMAEIAAQTGYKD